MPFLFPSSITDGCVLNSDEKMFVGKGDYLGGTGPVSRFPNTLFVCASLSLPTPFLDMAQVLFPRHCLDIATRCWKLQEVAL